MLAAAAYWAASMDPNFRYKHASIHTLTGFRAGFLCDDVLSRAPALIDDVADGVKRKQELQRGISHKVPHDMSQDGKL